MSSCVFGPQATRASGENFHRRQGLLPPDMVFSPVIARGCTSSLGSWAQWFSLPFPITSAGMTRGSDVRSSSPTSRRAPQGCAPPACGPPSCACPSCVAPSCSASLAEVMGSHPSFHGHKATPRPAAPHPLAALAALAAASPHSYYRSPRPGLSISHRRADPWCLGRMLAEALPICRGKQWW